MTQLQADQLGNMPKDSESFGTVRPDAEAFGSLPNCSARKERHTLTVREVARMFEQAGVPRTERSIINWCQPNKLGVPRLDCYLDPNERKYYLTAESVELGIAEEKAKAAKGSVSEPGGSLGQGSEGEFDSAKTAGALERASKLEKAVMDLKILNSAKDFVIEQLRQERDGFFGQLLDASRKVGELETKLLQLSAPGDSRDRPETG
jgi:hypothetical protein